MCKSQRCLLVTICNSAVCRCDDILIKVLHNEREQLLDSAVATPVESVYYRWEDIKSYLLAQIK
ncbi:MAG: hypothetical protein IJO90_08035 [Alistipes sp.]|nr:hypothetical protein [Alistipes sp.]